MKRGYLCLLFVVSLCAGCAGGSSDGAAVAAAGVTPAGGSAAAPAPPQPMDFGPVVMGEAPAHDYSAAQIARGKSLVAFGGCNDCHTPFNIDPETGATYQDMSRMLSGHPRNAPDPIGPLTPGDMAIFGGSGTSIMMPIGIVYTANLTPDISSGTGSWTEQMFLDIFRTAKHLGGDGRPVLPPMPWPSVASLPDEDIIAIFAYLRSIPPIVNAVPSVTVPEEVMEGIGMGNAAILEQLNGR